MLKIKDLNIDTEKRVIICVLLLVVFLASLPALNPVVYTGHDLMFHINRIEQLAEGLRNGDFPARVFHNDYNGYGYGTPLYYPYLFLYIPAILNVIGLPVAYCYNLFVVIINIATALIAYYSYSVITKSPRVGVISAAIYCLAFYRLLDVYSRGAVGEYLALVFCPLVVAGLMQILRGETDKWYVLALGAFGVAQSHLLTLIMMAMFALLFIVVNIKGYLEKEKIVALLKAGAAVILLNLWYIIPMLEGMKIDLDVNTTGSDFYGTSCYLSALLNLTTPDVYTPEDCVIGGNGKTFSRTVGITVIAGTVFYILSFIFDDNKEKKSKSSTISKLLLFELLGFWMTSIFFPWKIIELIPGVNTFFEKFQFIWRFNVIVLLFGSPVAAAGYYRFFVDVVSYDKGKLRRILIVCLCICAYSLAFTNRFVYERTPISNELMTNQGAIDRLYLKKDSTIPDRPDFESNNNSFEYSDFAREYGSISFGYTMENSTENYVDVPLTYYPGYAAYINGEKTDVFCAETGVVRVTIPNGLSDGNVTVKYTEKTLWVVADLISLVSVIAFVVLMGKPKIKNISLH